MPKTLREIRHEFIKVAAELARCEGMPPSDLRDWPITKSTTSRKLTRSIVIRTDNAESQCKEWAVRIRDLADSLIRFEMEE